MNTGMLNFYTYGRKFAPEGWPVVNPPYVSRLYFIYSGTAYFLKGAEEYKLQPRHLYIFPHNLEFRVRQDNNNPLDHLFFDFVIIPPFIFHELIEMPIQEDSPIGYTVAALSSLFSQYGDKGSDPDLPRLVKSYFESLLLLIGKERQLAQLGDIRLISVLEYINSNYSKSISTHELALMANLEENHFIRIFKKAMFVTPYQYLREYRLNIAVSLLESGMTVFETAQKIGYENASSFSSAIKKSRKVYPTEIKKNVRNRM